MKDHPLAVFLTDIYIKRQSAHFHDDQLLSSIHGESVFPVLMHHGCGEKKYRDKVVVLQRRMQRYRGRTRR